MKLKGLELLFHIEKNNFRSNEDLIVAVAHCYLINLDFTCVGQGEEWTNISNGESSELLPPEWNTTLGQYTLRYVKDNDRYMLKVIKAEPAMLINLLDVSKEKVASTTLKANDYVCSLTDFKSAIKDETKLLNCLQEVVQQQPNKEQEEDTDPLRVNLNPVSSRRQQEAGRPDLGNLRDPFNIGRSDLDPFGANPGNSGMLFDPFGMRRPFNPASGIPGGVLPRGAVPPGARFDPFGPRFPGFNQRPNPDHLQPPDYDDMFS